MKEWSIAKAGVCALAGLAFIFLRFLYTAFAFPVLHANSDMAASTWIVLLTASALAQGLAVLYIRRGNHLLGSTFIVALCTMATVGMLLMYFSLDVFENRSLCYAGAAVTAFGAGMLPPCWKEVSSCYTTKQRQMLMVYLAIITASMLYLVCLSLPYVIAVGLNSLAPLLSALLLRQAYLERQSSLPLQQTTRRVDEMAKEPAERHMPRMAKAGKVSFAALTVFLVLLSIPQSFWKTEALPFVTTSGFSWTLMVAASILLVSLSGVVDQFLRRKNGSSQLAFTVLFGETILVMLLPFFVKNHSIMNISVLSGLLLYWAIFYSEIDEIPDQPGYGVKAYAECLLISNLAMFAGTLGASLSQQGSLPFIGIALGIATIASFVLRLRTYGGMPNRFAQDYGTSDAPAHAPVSDMQTGISSQCKHAIHAYNLSEREGEILEYLVRGRSAKSISAELFISYNTVKTYMGRIYKKLDVHSREELIIKVEAAPKEPVSA